jgi:hypothetical protein
MTQETLESMSILTAILSALAAVFSAVTAFSSYRLARKIHHDLKTDERIIAGRPIHPTLDVPAHSACVIQCTLFNKSKRKAFVNAVSVRDRRNTEIDVMWSDTIDPLGHPQNPCELLGLVDACSLFIRRNDAEAIEYALISISHSFSDIPVEVIFDSLAGW